MLASYLNCSKVSLLSNLRKKPGVLIRIIAGKYLVDFSKLSANEKSLSERETEKDLNKAE